MELFAEDQNPVVWCIALSAFQVLSPTSPPVLAPRPVWGPAAGSWAPRSTPPEKTTEPCTHC